MKKSGTEAFTLIELLVVISIIALLAAILFPAINGAIRTGKINRAGAECNSIAGAVEAYFSDHRKYPTSSQGGGDTGPSINEDVIKVLVGEDNDLNPTGKVYLRFEGNILSGEVFDPWKKQYRLMMDTDFDNKLTYESKKFGVRCIVVSSGPDRIEGNADDIANVNLLD